MAAVAAAAATAAAGEATAAAVDNNVNPTPRSIPEAGKEGNTGGDRQASVSGGSGGGSQLGLAGAVTTSEGLLGIREAERRPGRPRLLAMKALAGFPWPAPPSLCHPGSGDASRVVHATACLGEEGGQAALIKALERWVRPPPRGKSGGARARGGILGLVG